jgi:type II secretory pathway pseudopilin PulG
MDRKKQEDGFTLIELLIATAMMIVITGAAVTFLISAMHRQSDVTGRSDQIGTARNALETITADLREGEKITAPTASAITVDTICNSGQACVVSYVCGPEAGTSTFGCTRSLGTGKPAVKVIGGLASAEVFCFYPNIERRECGTVGGEKPRYVGVTLKMPQTKGVQGLAVLESGAALHNAEASPESGA